MPHTLKTQFPRMLTVLMIAMLVVPGVMTRDAGAQRAPVSASYESELSGLTVEVDGDFEITGTDSDTYAGGAGETVTINSDDAFVMVGFFDDADDPATTIGLYHQGFSDEYGDLTVLDEGTNRGVAWSVASGTSAGETSVFYISVSPDVVGNVDVMTFILAPEDHFIGSFEDAQYDITIDGDGVFQEANLDELGAVLESGDPSSAETPVPVEGSPRESTSGDVTVSEVTGIEVQTGGKWQVVNQEITGEGRLKEESLQIQSVYANGYIAFFLGDDAQLALDGFFEGFDSSAQSRETLAQDYRHGVAWSFDHAVLGDGVEVYVYTEIQEGFDPDYLVLSAVLAEPKDFLSELAAAQDNITLDGESIFPDVDVDSLGEMLTGTTETTPEPEATVVGTAAESGNPREHARLPGSEENGDETEPAGTAVTEDLDFTAAGLISETEYESPQYGVDVTWGPSWYVDLQDEEAVITDPVGEVDSLTLIWNGLDTALMFIDIVPADDLVPADFVDYWTSDSYMSEYLAPGGESLLKRSRRDHGAVVMRDYTDSGTEIIVVREAILLNRGENLAFVTLISAPENFGLLYGDAQEDFDIAGDPGISTFSLRQIERAIDR